MPPTNADISAAGAHERIDKLVDEFADFRVRSEQRHGEIRAALVRIEGHESEAKAALAHMGEVITEKVDGAIFLAEEALDAATAARKDAAPAVAFHAHLIARRARLRRLVWGVAQTVLGSAALAALAWALAHATGCAPV